jgi:hypothetical protein
MDIDLVFHIPQSKTKEPNAQGCLELPTTHGNEYPTLLHSASCAEVAELIDDARMPKRCAVWVRKMPYISRFRSIPASVHKTRHIRE